MTTTTKAWGPNNYNKKTREAQQLQQQQNHEIPEITTTKASSPNYYNNNKAINS